MSDSYNTLALIAQGHGRTESSTQIGQFAFASEVLPAVTETLPVAELARRSLMSIYGRQNPDANGAKGRSRTFAGHELPDQRRIDQHQHAFYLPTDEDGDGRLDRITIFAEEGFGAGELHALESLRELRGQGRGMANPLRLEPIGIPRSAERSKSLLATACRWISATPFVAPRHVKRNGTKRDPANVLKDVPAFLRLVLKEELTRIVSHLGTMSIDDVRIEPILDENGAFRVGPRRLNPLQFKRARAKDGGEGSRRLAGAFRLTFNRPVAGPIVLGHCAHFGLGLFVPELDAAAQ